MVSLLRNSKPKEAGNYSFVIKLLIFEVLSVGYFIYSYSSYPSYPSYPLYPSYPSYPYEYEEYEEYDHMMDIKNMNVFKQYEFKYEWKRRNMKYE